MPCLRDHGDCGHFIPKAFRGLLCSTMACVEANTGHEALIKHFLKAQSLFQANYLHVELGLFLSDCSTSDTHHQSRTGIRWQICRPRHALQSAPRVGLTGHYRWEGSSGKELRSQRWLWGGCQRAAWPSPPLLLSEARRGLPYRAAPDFLFCFWRLAGSRFPLNMIKTWIGHILQTHPKFSGETSLDCSLWERGKTPCVTVTVDLEHQASPMSVLS